MESLPSIRKETGGPVRGPEGKERIYAAVDGKDKGKGRISTIYGLFLWGTGPFSCFLFRICRVGRAFDLACITINTFIPVNLHVLLAFVNRVHGAQFYASSAVDAIIVYCSCHNIATFLLIINRFAFLLLPAFVPGSGVFRFQLSFFLNHLDVFFREVRVIRCAAYVMLADQEFHAMVAKLSLIHI